MKLTRHTELWEMIPEEDRRHEIIVTRDGPMVVEALAHLKGSSFWREHSTTWEIRASA